MSTLTTDTHLPFSVNINLNHVDASYEPKITFPIVQGMSFVTGGYRNATPIVQCPGDGFTSITGPFAVSKSTKYKIVDNDKRNWLLYINPVPRLPFDPKAFAAWDQWNFVGPSFFKGTLQIAKNPLGDQGEALYDKAASTFVTEAKITGTVNEARGQYAFDYTKVGGSPLLVFILPHHLQSLEPNLRPLVTKLQLRTTTKGMATAIWAERLSFIEPNLPLSMGFAPWHPSTGTTRQRYSSPVLRAMLQAAEHDLQIALTERTSPDSMYYAGKTLARLATIVWCMKEVLNYVNPPGLDKLKKEMSRYVANQQRYPLFYDDTWKGLVSNAGFPNDPTADFGNTYYNDHHFHYSYFVYTAAVLGSLDPEWLTEGDNKAWTQSLVKDYAESDTESAKGGGGSRDFPFFRHFDWWMGHSWARGLFECPDGKDEESSGEDGFASFAIKMWGKVIGDVDMEKRGEPVINHLSRCSLLLTRRVVVRELDASPPSPQFQQLLLPYIDQHQSPTALHRQQSHRDSL
jgi:endo-1,3(4)-beta-glucanase